MIRDPKPHRGEVKRGSVLLNIIEVEGSWGIMAPLKKCYRKYHGIQVNSSGSKYPDFSWILCWGHVEIWLAWVNRKQRAWDLGESYWPWEIGSGKPLAQGQKDRVVGSRYANVFWLIKASGHCSQGGFELILRSNSTLCVDLHFYYYKDLWNSTSEELEWASIVFV